MLKFIQCPECTHSPLIFEEDKLLCGKCQATFDVVERVPVLLKTEKMGQQEKSQKIWFEEHYSSFSKTEYRLERWRESMLRRVFNQDLKNVKTYLDIGCGATGYTVIEAAKRNGWTAVGADISLEAMIRAKKLAEKQGVADKTAFVVCSAENIPFRNNYFDYVSLISVLEHLENDQNVIDGVSQILKPEGRLYICVPNAYSKIWPFLWPFYFWKDWKIGHQRHYSAKMLNRLLTRENLFQREKVFYNGHLIKLYQILAEKLGPMSEEKWWKIEKRDINRDISGLQLNAVYRKDKTKKEKVILLNPPLYFSNGLPKSLDVSAPPLGALYLATYINKYSDFFEAKIIDVGAEKLKLAEIIKKIKKIRPFAISLSAMTPQLQGALELAKAVKKNFPDLKIFLGGPHVSADPDFANRHPGLFDYVITGESEKTFLESLNKLVAGDSIPSVQAGESILNLDELPILNLCLVNQKLYSPAASVMFSRGCPFHCYYCSRPSISRQVRYRSAENMLEEIKMYLLEGISQINFQDDTFTMNREKVIELCRQIIAENIKIKWGCNTRIDLVDDELLLAMKKAGCEQINFGIESGSERLRKEIIHKGNFSNQDIYNVFALCRRHKIKIAGYFMLGHPTETKEELAETKKMILESRIDVLGLSLPIPFPDSELWEIAKREGMINEEIIDKFARKELGEGYAGVYPVYISKSLDPEFVYQKMREINRKFYLNFKMFASRLKEDMLSPRTLMSDTKDLLSLIIKGMSSRKPYARKSK